jgi:hypothetical protein
VGPPDSIPLLSDWARVGQLTAGSEILVTTRSSQPRGRYFVLAETSAIVVLNAGSPALPPRSVRALRAMVSDNPEAVADVLTKGAVARDDLRLGREGLFVADRKVADLAAVIERIAREDVIEIRGPVVTRGSAGGAALGGWLGFAVGALPGLGGASQGVAVLALIGGAATGAYLGDRWSTHLTDDIVYRAAASAP